MQLVYLAAVFVSGMPGFCLPAASVGHEICHTLQAKQTNRQQNTQPAPQRKGLFHPFLNAFSTVPIQSPASSLPANQNLAVFVLWWRVFESCRDGMRLWRHISENTNTAVLRNRRQPSSPPALLHSTGEGRDGGVKKNK